MAQRIEAGVCSVTGYNKQSLECANCMYNHVEDILKFSHARDKKNKTNGSVCLAPSPNTEPPKPIKPTIENNNKKQ